MGGSQHILLRKGEDKHGIVRHIFPLDEIFYHITVSFKGQHMPYDLDSKFLLF